MADPSKSMNEIKCIARSKRSQTQKTMRPRISLSFVPEEVKIQEVGELSGFQGLGSGGKKGPHKLCTESCSDS